MKQLTRKIVLMVEFQNPGSDVSAIQSERCCGSLRDQPQSTVVEFFGRSFFTIEHSFLNQIEFQLGQQQLIEKTCSGRLHHLIFTSRKGFCCHFEQLGSFVAVLRSKNSLGKFLHDRDGILCQCRIIHQFGQCVTYLFKACSFAIIQIPHTFDLKSPNATLLIDDGTLIFLEQRTIFEIAGIGVRHSHGREGPHGIQLDQNGVHPSDFINTWSHEPLGRLPLQLEQLDRLFFCTDRSASSINLLKKCLNLIHASIWQSQLVRVQIRPRE